jgi:hypothetical protein
LQESIEEKKEEKVLCRKGTTQHPIITYARDAATDVIAAGIAHRKEGF